MTPFSFRAERIELRAFEPADVAALHVLLNRPELAGRRYLPDDFRDAAPLSIRQVEKILEHWDKETGSWTLAVVEPSSGNLIGHARVDWEWDPHCPSTCVVISPDHQRRGFGSAALDVALRFLFEETTAHVVSAWMSSWNEPALEFARRNRFREAGRRPRAGLHAGGYFAEVAFDLLRTEWVEGRRDRHAA